MKRKRSTALHCARNSACADALGLATDGYGTDAPEARKLRRALKVLAKARGTLEVLQWETCELAQRAIDAGRGPYSDGAAQ
jgi:hypothetical protein